MVGYYKQCHCLRLSDVVPCYTCLEAENQRLREALEEIAKFARERDCQMYLETVATFAEQVLEGGNTNGKGI